MLFNKLSGKSCCGQLLWILFAGKELFWDISL